MCRRRCIKGAATRRHRTRERLRPDFVGAATLKRIGDAAGAGRNSRCTLSPIPFAGPPASRHEYRERHRSVGGISRRQDQSAACGLTAQSRNCLRLVLAAAREAGQLLAAEKVPGARKHGEWRVAALVEGEIQRHPSYREALHVPCPNSERRVVSAGAEPAAGPLRLGIATAPKAARERIGIPMLMEPIRIAGGLLESLREE